MVKRSSAWLAATAVVFGLVPASAFAAPTYVTVAQTEMRVVSVDSVDGSGEGGNGSAELVLDGKPETYWQTSAQEPFAPLPHQITIKVGQTVQPVGRVRLLPRQSADGSGRMGKYNLYASADTSCADSTFVPVASGEFDGLIANRATERTITLDKPVNATCLKVEYLSSWGELKAGETVSAPGVAASLAELNVDLDTATSAIDIANGASAAPASPATQMTPANTAATSENSFTISDGTLTVRLHAKFPQVIDYAVAGSTLAGKYDPAALTEVLINEEPTAVTVGQPVAEAAKVAYPLSFPSLKGVSLKAELSVAEGVFTWKLTDIVDPAKTVRRIRVPRLDLVTVASDDPKSSIRIGHLGVNRARPIDITLGLNETTPEYGSFTSVISNSVLAAGFETNAIEDNTAGGITAERSYRDMNRYVNQVVDYDGQRLGVISPGTFVVRGSTADLGIGADSDPFVRVKVVADSNRDGVVDWQDGAIAARAVMEKIPGSDEVSNLVVRRIPFNIVSQATHPFLRTLDDTRRIAMATDQLGQWVMLKGYQAEGHDSAQGDYAGHYNERAGGRKDLITLVNEGELLNATFGVHVNTTETYSEAKAFSEELLQMPPKAGWGWMNQAYLMDGAKDLGTGNVLRRFQELRDDMPDNLSFLYMDVYYPDGWEAQRLAHELSKQGWVLSTEWADKFPRLSTWSHWANDEKYGGNDYKGITSDLLRFIQNSQRDIWNPHPILSNANIQEFEGWSKNNDANLFFDMVWQRNLPTKFLQRSDIMRWEENRIVFANGTVATSPLTSISGTEIPTNREITFDGATVYTQGRYLLPWSDGGERLYHYNPEGGTTQWELTASWAAQKELTMYRLTDTGRQDEVKVPVVDGKVTLEAQPGQAYVLFPSGKVSEPITPDWGHGQALVDPGFFSGTLDAYDTAGAVSVQQDVKRNFHAEFGPGAGHLAQPLRYSAASGFKVSNSQAGQSRAARTTRAATNSTYLPAGTYSAWAWVEIEPGKTREVSLLVTGAAEESSAVEPVPGTSASPSASEETPVPIPVESASAVPTPGDSVQNLAPSAGAFPESTDAPSSVLSQAPALPAGVRPGLPKTEGEERAKTEDGLPIYGSATINYSGARNTTGSDEKHLQYYQRLRVTFTTPGGPSTLWVKVGEGDAKVKVDDLRVVRFTPATDPAPTPQTVLFEDFEHVDTGYGPFVSGSSQRGDARTQLSQRHEPYSQKGWWAKNLDGQVVEGGKLTDNVLDGDWSLMAHEENNGAILRTTQALMPLMPGHKYRFSFDAQVAFARTYNLLHGVDKPTESGTSEVIVDRVALPQARDTQRISYEFVADSCHAGSFIGFEKIAGGHQANLTIDNVRLEDLGVSDTGRSCGDFVVNVPAAAKAGSTFDVTVEFASAETNKVEEADFEVSGPQSWIIEKVSADSVIEIGGTARAAFRVTTTPEQRSGNLEVKLRYNFDGKVKTVADTRVVTGYVAGENYLSDFKSLVVGTPRNGRGPVEWDMSNGGRDAGDGKTIAIAGKEFAKGIGTHAASRVVFELPRQCTAITASVGVDDESSSAAASVRFSITGDGGAVLLPQTSIKKLGEAATDIRADIAGHRRIALIVDNGGNGNDGDYASWADAKVICS